ncbi:hypothetical protein Fluta_1929 [Fluviicola taffensis DSM 16823]|uniref:Uncharacterized protein n=1 Tax=Fluviicola taffensis (strain DSM 16823 / NCIMB 13979 / RW262) TaxID=755732 RepID=F2IJM6_FLUTR|nr:hypothetical protein Fluta_1929 [Fluviicola taffensis DSM 16823]
MKKNVKIFQNEKLEVEMAKNDVSNLEKMESNS